MSRHYDMTVSILGYDKKQKYEIQIAAETEWDFCDWHGMDGELISSGEGNLGGGESEDEFSRRLAMAIWEANGKFCQVDVCATCLEDLPYETYGFNKDDYKRIMDK